MDQYHLHNRMPIRLRFAFFRFHVRNVYFMWYYNRRNGRYVHQQLTPGEGPHGRHVMPAHSQSAKTARWWQ